MNMLLLASVFPSTALLLLNKPLQALLNLLLYAIALVAAMAGYIEWLLLIPVSILHVLFMLWLHRYPVRKNLIPPKMRKS